jgi:predicted nucleic acid-binding protein
MFALDTNVVFELRKAKVGHYKQVVRLGGRRARATMYVSVITILELETGVLLVQRRDAAQGALLCRGSISTCCRHFAERVLPVDTAVARRYVARCTCQLAAQSAKRSSRPRPWYTAGPWSPARLPTLRELTLP